jgi:hypothetical protein
LKATKDNGDGSNCERCKKSKIRYKVVYHAPDNYGNQKPHTTYVCLKCLHLYKFEAKYKVNPKTHLMVHNFINDDLSKEATAFIEKKLGAFNFVGRATVFISMKTHEIAVTDIMCKHRFPTKPRNLGGVPWVEWLEAKVAVRRDLPYPHTKKLNVASVQVKDAAAKVLMGGVKWFYETDDVTFNDAAEFLVYGAGYGAFKILRTLKLVPGLASKIGMTNYGLAWMKEFREQRPKPKTKTKPSTRPEMSYAQG